MRLEQIPLDELCHYSPYHVKQQNIEKDLDDLIISIKALGLVNPIIVYDTKSDNVTKDITDGRYDIIDGQRRFRALLNLNELNPDQGFDKAECVIHEKLDEMQKRAISFACNAFSAKPSKADLSDTITRLYGESLHNNICQKKFGVPKQMIRKCVGLARLPQEVKDAINGGAIHSNSKIALKYALMAVDALAWEPGNDVDVETVIEDAKKTR